MAGLLIFDLDGTLSDSAPGILAALRHAFAENGVAPMDAVTEQTLLGPPFYTSLPPLIGGDEKLSAVIAAYRSHYAAGSMYDTRVYPGVVEVLRAAQVTGRRMAVATSKPEHFAVPIVERLGLAEYFEVVGGDTIDGERDTKALVIASVLDRLGDPDPEDAVMIGDREQDVFGARTHGIGCVGAGWGYGLPGELSAAGAAPICAQPLELLATFGLSDSGDSSDDVSGAAGVASS